MSVFTTIEDRGSVSYVVDGRISSVDGVTTRNSPAVQCVPVDQRVAALEVGRELEQRVVLVLDILPRDLLLDDLLAPIVVEPGLRDDFGCGSRGEQRVVLARDIKINLHARIMVRWCETRGSEGSALCS